MWKDKIMYRFTKLVKFDLTIVESNTSLFISHHDISYGLIQRTVAAAEQNGGIELNAFVSNYPARDKHSKYFQIAT